MRSKLRQFYKNETESLYHLIRMLHLNNAIVMIILLQVGGKNIIHQT